MQINTRSLLNNTIKNSYKKNIDYKIEKVKKSQGSGGHNFEVITLTHEACKQICINTNSKIGPIIRKNFIDIEIQFSNFNNNKS